jgi:hypothetical protein
MTWSTNEARHYEMVENIQRVCRESDERKRWRLALGYVASSAAHYAEPEERVGSYCSVLAMAALHPETYLLENFEPKASE